MGWCVLGMGSLYADEKNMEKIIKKMDAISKKEGGYFYEVEGNCGDISFRIEGNKMIDYAPVDRLKKWLIKNKIKAEISINEYVESEGGGYYYSAYEG